MKFKIAPNKKTMAFKENPGLMKISLIYFEKLIVNNLAVVGISIFNFQKSNRYMNHTPLDPPLPGGNF
ncbi:MAG: hypothetical protein HZA01_12670 [Nitrospinae bacterium]|nr:hypothetical protein [Nitrospinota bacterium]